MKYEPLNSICPNETGVQQMLTVWDQNMNDIWDIAVQKYELIFINALHKPPECTTYKTLDIK